MILPLTLALALSLPAAAPQDVDGRYGEYLATTDALREPITAAFDGTGRAFVVEAAAHRVSVLDAEGGVARRFGVRGSGDGELESPRGIAVSPDEVFVADTGNHRIAVFDHEGAFRRHIGGFGTEPGRLVRPVGLALEGELLLVADSGNDRVQAFTPAGELVRIVGASGRGDGELRGPTAVAFAGELGIAVVDTGNHRVSLFSRDGEALRSFGARGPNPGLFSSPVAVAAADERLLVVDRGNHRVQAFAPDGEYLYEWGIHVLRPREGEGRLHYPSGIAVRADGERVLVCEGFSDRVQHFGRAQGPASLYMTDPATLSQGPARHYGRSIASDGDVLLVAEPESESVIVFAIQDTTPLIVARLGGFGTAADELVDVAGVAIGGGGKDVVVADALTRKLSHFHLDRERGEAPRFDPTLGTFVRSVDVEALREWRFDELDGPIAPGSVERAPDGTLFVVDTLRSRVLVLSPKLALVRVIGEGELASPTDLELAGAQLFVADSANRRIAVFDEAGALVRTLEGGLEDPFGVAVGADGTAFVTDVGTHSIAVFSPAGQRVRTIGTEGLGPVEFFKPRGVAFDDRGRLIVLDHGNHRGQILTPEGEFVAAFGSRLYARAARVPARSSNPTD